MIHVMWFACPATELQLTAINIDLITSKTFFVIATVAMNFKQFLGQSVEASIMLWDSIVTLV